MTFLMPQALMVQPGLGSVVDSNLTESFLDLKALDCFRSQGHHLQARLSSDGTSARRNTLYGPPLLAGFSHAATHIAMSFQIRALPKDRPPPWHTAAAFVSNI